MQEIANQTALAFSAAQLDLIRRTVAADCTTEEFSLFIEVVKSLRLDPFRRQVHPVIYDAKKASRKMSIIVGIDGMRRIAARSGNYRPDSAAPVYEIDQDAKDPETNPHGIISCSLNCFQRDAGGEWFPVLGQAFWDEFAPVVDEWKWGDQRGERVSTGKKTLGGQWGKMPRLMIAKCAEAQALRKGWPDDLSAVYSPEEMSIADAQELASERLEKREREQQQARLLLQHRAEARAMHAHLPVDQGRPAPAQPHLLHEHAVDGRARGGSAAAEAAE